MIPPPSALATRLYVALWLVVLVLPVLGWLVGALVVAAFGRRGQGNPLRRAAFHAGEVALLLLLVPFAVRAALWLVLALGGGPVQWLKALVPAWPWTLQDVALVWAAPLGLLAAVGIPALALISCLRRDAPPARVPLGLPVAAALALSALLVPFLARFPWSEPDAAIVAVDLFIALPIAAIGAALWTAAARTAPPEAPTRAAADPARALPPIDIPATWRRLGAIAANAAPIDVPARRAADPRPVPGPWRDAGGHGPPPTALADLAREAERPGTGWLVGDLDDHTERTFAVAALLDAIRHRGLTALVITEEPDAFRAELVAALGRSGSWDCGPIASGATELRGALAGGRLPAAAFVDARALSSEVIRALSSGRDDAGLAWARAVGVVFTSRVDRGAPLEVTHRLFTLRRLHLALRAAAARFSVIATGVGGVGTVGLVEQAFPGVAVKEVPFGAVATSAVRVWLAQETFVKAPSDRVWVRRALEPVAETGRAVSVSDPAGRFDQAAVSVWGRDVSLARSPALRGAASAGTLSEAWLVAGFRDLRNRPPDGADEVHHALWGVSHSPVARFLTAPGALENLQRTGRLKPPRPLVGYGNPLIARAHLQAALREGRQDLPSLQALFGRPLVDPIAGGPDESAGHVLRPDPAGALRRVPVAPVPPDAVDDPVRGTVTAAVVRVLDRNTGAVLAEVDRAVATTRYYAKRVFAVGDRRYEVELHAFDEARGDLPVQPVGDKEALTQPLLAYEVGDPRLVEARHEVRLGGVQLELAGFELTVDEIVTGVLGEDGHEVRYAPIRARYRTRARAIAIPREASAAALRHLGASLRDVLVAHLLGGPEDFDVTALPDGLGPLRHPTLVIVDRHVQGIGVMEAVDDLVALDALEWVRAILANCPCAAGCPRCTPPEVLRVGPEPAAAGAATPGPDKVGVLRLLGG